MAVIPPLVAPVLFLGFSGANLLVTFGAAMVVIVLVSLSLRPMAKRMAAVSGLYSYTAKGLGQAPAITVGWSAIFGYGFVAMGSLLAVGTYVLQFLINLGVQLPDSRSFLVLTVVAASCGACVLMVRGIRISSWFTLSVESIAIAVIAVLMVGYFALKAPRASLSSELVWNGDLDSLWLGIVVAVSAFVGFESATTLGGEAHKPFVNVPRAITWTPIVTGVLFVLAAAAQDMALKEASEDITASSTPLSDLIARSSPAFAAVLDLGIAASWFACSIASVNALSRILFCMGREGVAPRMVGRTHPVFQSPSTAIMVVMPVVALVPIAMAVSGATLQQGLAALFTLGAYGYLGAYVLATASLPFFLRRIGEDTYISWILGPATSLAIVAVLGLAAVVSIHAGNLATFVYGGVVLTSILYAAFLRLRSPERLASVGIYDETRELDLFRGEPTR
ncbi:APC family permease [Sinomonas flava]|uniref:APC family permease n=1 Tax=Sinomonas flava TaxID=496857 RepID=UPI0039A48C28